MKKVAAVLCVVLLVTLFGGASTRIVNATAKVKSIEITALPERCAYNVGDGYSTKGMVVVAKMSDGTKETIDNSKITSFSGVELAEGRAFTQEGWKSVELRYGGVKTTYGIAVFDPLKEYFITYNSDGGSAVDAKKIDASTKEFKLPTPTKKGATFLGWYHSNGTKYTKYQPGIGTNVELKAKWGYAIIFNANGGTGKMKNGVIDKDYKLPKNKFKKSGYKFVGWSTKKSADNMSFYEVGAPGAYIPNKSKNVTLYAQWVKTGTYKISYVSVKGVKIPSGAIKKYTAGKTTVLPYPTITGDKNFGGWQITIKGKKYGEFTEIPPYLSGDMKLTPVLVDFEG
nr:InlB B-repeat-containing protein [uncultured Anaerosporobacter sp.]